jgi:hypothetical protein
MSRRHSLPLQRPVGSPLPTAPWGSAPASAGLHPPQMLPLFCCPGPPRRNNFRGPATPHLGPPLPAVGPALSPVANCHPTLPEPPLNFVSLTWGWSWPAATQSFPALPFRPFQISIHLVSLPLPPKKNSKRQTVNN